ncbi:MAG: DMT family transporter [Pseudorhodoplanes sp.]
MSFRPRLPRGDTTILGIGLAVLSVFLFAFNNGYGKLLIQSIPAGQFVLMRSLASAVLLAPFCWRGGLAPFREAPRKGLQVVRVVFAAMEVMLFYVAVSYLPLAETLTFWLAAPIYVTALSAIFLGEKVGWRRWTAVGVGFIGVLIVMRPSTAAMSWPALFAFIGGILYSCGMTVTRAIRSTPDTVLMAGYLVGVTLIGFISLLFDAKMPTGTEMLATTALAIVSVAAQLFFIRSLKLAPASVIAPYQNTTIVWGALFGFLIFGEIPDLIAVVGAAIIVAASLYIFLRERRLGKSTVPLEPVE